MGVCIIWDGFELWQICEFRGKYFAVIQLLIVRLLQIIHIEQQLCSDNLC